MAKLNRASLALIPRLYKRDSENLVGEGDVGLITHLI